MFLLLAVSLPSAMWGQNTQPIQPNGAAQVQPGRLEDDPGFQRLSPEQQDWVRTLTQRVDKALADKDVAALDQISLDVTKHQLLGKTMCGHRVDDGTFVDAVATNASRQDAIAMRWLDAKGSAVHSAIFTGDARCVAKDGDSLEGKAIVRVLPNSLAVSNQHGLTAWEGEYWNSPVEQAAGGAPHRGAFIENRFLVELDPHKTSPAGSPDLSDKDRDFQWNKDQETLAVKPGIALATVAPHTNANVPPQTQPASGAKPCIPQTQQGPKVNVKAPPKASAWACQHLGICPDNKPVVLNPDNGCPAAPATGQTAK